MKKLTVPGAQDIVRIIGSNDLETERNLFSFYTDPSGGFFSYRLSHGLCRHAYGRTLPLQQILAGCERLHNKQGRNCNKEILRLVWDLAAGRPIYTSELPTKTLVLRKDLSIRVAPAFYYVESRRASAFYLQPRKDRKYALSLAQMGLLASIMKATYLVDDFEGVGFEICDLSAPPGQDRQPRIFTLKDFNLLSEAEVNELLQRFARAYDTLKARGIEQKKRPPKRPPAGPDLFKDPE